MCELFGIQSVTGGIRLDRMTTAQNRNFTAAPYDKVALSDMTNSL